MDVLTKEFSLPIRHNLPDITSCYNPDSKTAPILNKIREGNGISRARLYKLAHLSPNNIVRTRARADLNPVIETSPKSRRRFDAGVDDLIEQ